MTRTEQLISDQDWKTWLWHWQMTRWLCLGCFWHFKQKELCWFEAAGSWCRQLVSSTPSPEHRLAFVSVEFTGNEHMGYPFLLFPVFIFTLILKRYLTCYSIVQRFEFCVQLISILSRAVKFLMPCMRIVCKFSYLQLRADLSLASMLIGESPIGLAPFFKKTTFTWLIP